MRISTRFRRHCRTCSSPPPCKTSKARRVLRRAMERVPGDMLLPASILDFKPRLGNRCKLFHDYTLLRASIHDFRLRLGNRCKKPSRTAQRLHRFLISSPNLGIDVSFSPETSFCVHRFLILGPDLRIDAAQSSWRWRTARLQDEHCGRRWGLDATKAA